ncbi:hypothetical protein LSAT2_009558 [Lamellibrachia satsuma]|nr:hypothetical protein LSAT2_009558 [Lamellibrachia satsuma]
MTHPFGPTRVVGNEADCQSRYSPSEITSHVCLPMIYMNASGMSCVYSAMRCVVTECVGHQLKPILICYTPLWWKAQLIIANEPSDSDVCSDNLRLRGLHAEMISLVAKTTCCQHQVSKNCLKLCMLKCTFSGI